eukprot:5520522-Alexandrium_andersonii.AAC.1
MRRGAAGQSRGRAGGRACLRVCVRANTAVEHTALPCKHSCVGESSIPHQAEYSSSGMNVGAPLQRGVAQ